MNGFYGYNQIKIIPVNQEKMAFIYPWVHSCTKKLPLSLKNVGAMLQQAMSYAFHDICNIVQRYLDDFPAHSHKRQDHLDHLK